MAEIQYLKFKIFTVLLIFMETIVSFGIAVNNKGDDGKCNQLNTWIFFSDIMGLIITGFLMAFFYSQRTVPSLRLVEYFQGKVPLSFGYIAICLVQIFWGLAVLVGSGCTDTDTTNVGWVLGTLQLLSLLLMICYTREQIYDKYLDCQIYIDDKRTRNFR